jgi:hypothetical protein
VLERDSEFVLGTVVLCALSSVLGAGQEEGINLMILLFSDIVLLLNGKSPLDIDRSTFTIFSIKANCRLNEGEVVHGVGVLWLVLDHLIAHVAVEQGLSYTVLRVVSLNAECCDVSHNILIECVLQR